MTQEEEAEARLALINRLSNGLGQTTITLCEGDWNLALGVATVLLASTAAQTAEISGDSLDELLLSVTNALRTVALDIAKQLRASKESVNE